MLVPDEYSFVSIAELEAVDTYADGWFLSSVYLFA